MGKRGSGRTHRCPADHQHGATQTCYTTHGCGCSQCLATKATAKQKRDRLKAYGRYESPLVDSAPTITKIETLRTDGWTHREIATAAGMKYAEQVQTLLARRVRKVHRDTEAAVLGIRSKPPKPQNGLVDPTGTRRRLRALARMGWSWLALAEASGHGWDNQFISRAATGDKAVMAKTADAVRELYERLADEPPRPGRGATRARNRAIADGWLAPIEWTGIDMDDPDAEPEPLEVDEAGWAVAEVAHLYALGESPTVAAAQLRSEPETLARLARRHGRKDLAVWLGETKRAA